MKVVMKSQDRNLFGIIVRQSTEGAMLNLSDLQEAYNLARHEFGWSERRVDKAFEVQENQERIYEILKESGKVNVDISTFTENLKSQPVKYLKSIGVWKTTRKEGTFVDPYVWVSIALWMNPKIYAKVVIWLTDTLIFNRINAGIQFRPMTDAIKQYLEPKCSDHQKQYLYANEANMINELVFGRKGKDLRQNATVDQLRMIETLERVNTNMISKGSTARERRVFLCDLV